jgi:hypothetical protein
MGIGKLGSAANATEGNNAKILILKIFLYITEPLSELVNRLIN